MALQFSTTKKEAIGHGVKCLVYGRAGMGKTFLCGTAPSPLIISAEAGLLTLRAKEIPVIVVKTVQDVWDALTWCKTNAAKQGIKTICLDSISEITEQILSSEQSKSNDTRQAYGKMATVAVDIVKSFRDLSGFHVLVTAKETSTTDPVTNASKAGPTAPGQQVGPALPYLFDEVFHAAVGSDQQGKTYHYLRTKGTFNIEAKDRSGALDEIEYPDLNNIISKILSVVPQAT